MVVAAVVLDMLRYLCSVTGRHPAVLARMLPVFAVLLVLAMLFAARYAVGACRAVFNTHAVRARYAVCARYHPISAPYACNNAISANHVPVIVMLLVLLMPLYLLSFDCLLCS